MVVHRLIVLVLFSAILINFQLYSWTLSDFRNAHTAGENIDMLYDAFYYGRSETAEHEKAKIFHFMLFRWLNEGRYDKVINFKVHEEVHQNHLLYYNILILIAQGYKNDKQDKRAYQLYQEIFQKSDDHILERESLSGMIEIIKKNRDIMALMELYNASRGEAHELYSNIEENLEELIAEHEYNSGLYAGAAERYLRLYRKNRNIKSKNNVRNTLKKLGSNQLASLDQHNLLWYYINNREHEKAEALISGIKKKRSAIPFYNNLFYNIHSSAIYSLKADNIYKAITRGRYPQSKGEYKKILSEYPYSYSAELAMFRLAVEYINRQEYENAMNIYKHIAEKRFFSSNYELFLTRIGILYLVRGNSDEAIEVFSQLSSSDSNAYSAIGKYFLAKIYISEKRYQKAGEVLIDLLMNNYNTYYSLMGEKLLSETEVNRFIARYKLRLIIHQFNPFRQNIEAIIAYSQFLYKIKRPLSEKRLYKAYAKDKIEKYIESCLGMEKERIKEGNVYYLKYNALYETGIYDLFSPYIQYLHNSSDNLYLTMHHIKALYENGHNLRAITVGNYFMNSLGISVDFRLLPEYLQEILFPVKYMDIIERYSEGIDPILIKSLIRQESGFNARAVSPRNAIGLMQVLPSTASGVARKHRVNYRRQSDLFDEELNIQIGVRYIESIFNRYKNINYALSAYNAGSRNANRWIAMYDGDDMDLFNFIITYKETREYVQLVLRNYIIYKSILYDE